MTQPFEASDQIQWLDPTKLFLREGRRRYPAPHDFLEIIEKSGQKSPIQVLPSGEIVFGANRWEACLKLTRPVMAIVKDLSELEARVDEIDENLKRSDLTRYDRDLLEAERQPLWQELHPETMPGRHQNRGNQYDWLKPNITNLEGSRNLEPSKLEMLDSDSEEEFDAEELAYREEERRAIQEDSVCDDVVTEEAEYSPPSKTTPPHIEDTYSQKRAKERGVSEAKVYAEIARGTALSPALSTSHPLATRVDAAIRALPRVADCAEELEALRRIPEPEARLEALESVMAGNAKTVRQAIQIKKEQVRNEIRGQQLQRDKTEPTIYLGDCVDWLDTLQDNTYDLLLTDPPYIVGADHRDTERELDYDEFLEFVWSWVPKALSKIKPTGRAYICVGAYPKELKAYLNTLVGAGDWIFDEILVWGYTNRLRQLPVFGYDRNYQNILYLRGPDAPPLCPETEKKNRAFVENQQVHMLAQGGGAEHYHAWQKPEELARRFITQGSSTGDSVLDPFACTGEFLIRAGELGRLAVGCEINEENLQIAVKRGCKRVCR